MKVSDIGYELSIRLGDPVGSDTPDNQGTVFSGEERFKYITRAYGKLTRMLKILMRDYQPEFNNRKKYSSLPVFFTPGEVNNTVNIPTSVQIDELFVAYQYKDGNTTKTNTAPASYIDPAKYLSHLYNVNDTKATSFAQGKIKYTIMTGTTTKIYLLPMPVLNESAYQRIHYMETPNFTIINWESEIPITSDYVDLLIDLAAIQGMQDIARADKAQLIERSIAQDWQILGQYGTYMKQTEGVKE